MLRRSKEDKDTETEAQDGDQTEEPTGKDPLETSLDERVGPLEEFRTNADNWMKETSAQLARVATHVQQDEKRQHKLDERLADFEERIQSMLTLTEALSLGDNPFVRTTSTPGGSTMPHERDLALSDETPTSNPAWDREEEGGPAAAELIKLDRHDTEAGDATSVDEHPTSDDAYGPPTEPDEARPHPHLDPEPEETPDAEAPLAEPDLPPLARGHPNDAALEGHAPPPASANGSHTAPTGPAQGPENGIGPHLDARAAQEAEERLLVLQWASLLARHMHRIDIDAFLETYLHTGWVAHEDVEKVRALAVDLARHATMSNEKLTREDLHIRTILLLSRLSTRTDRGARQAQRLVEETRSLAEAPWLHAER